MKHSPTISRLAVVVAAVCLLAAVGCGGSGDKGGETGGAGIGTAARTVEVSDWDAWLSGGGGEQVRAARAARPGHVVVIGIDGAAWWWIDQLIERGRLPNLARIKREGAHASLRSTRSFVTPPAWTSMFTGYLPEQTGIYSFGKWVSATRQFLTVNSDDVKVPFTWDAASRAGRKAGVFNVPMTFPVHPVNGAVVSGMMTPIEAANAIRVTLVTDERLASLFRPDTRARNFSRPVQASVSDSLNMFLIVVHDTVDDQVQKYDRVSVRILSNAAGDADSPDLGTYLFDAGEYSPWLSIRYNKNGTVVPARTRINLKVAGEGEFDLEFSQTIFPIDEPFTHPPELRDVLTKRFGFYLPTKFLSKEVVPALTEDMADYMSFFYDYDDWDLFYFVFTQSDNIHHLVGFDDVAAEVYETIDRAIGTMMDALPPGGTLVVASDHGNGEFDYAIDLNQFFTRLKLLEWKSEGEIEYDNTIAFHNLWQVYFNRDKVTREDLSARGIDVPAGADPYDFLVTYITEAGAALRSREGRAFPAVFHRLDNRTDEDDPHMWVEGAGADYVIDYWNIMKPHKRLIREAKGTDQWWHIRDGILLVWGDNARAGYDGGVKAIENVGPTLLYAAGLPVAPDMDGSVMFDMLKSDYVVARPLFVNRGYRDIPREAIMSADERESLEKKLKSLGYIQ